MGLKSHDLRNMTEQELNMKLDSLREELFRLHYEARTGRVEKPHRLKDIRRDVARIMTIINEKEKTGAKH